jgi:HSP20 family protein
MLNPLIPFGNEEEPLSDLHREIDRAFKTMFRGHNGNRLWSAENSLAAISPNVDVSETDKEITIIAELPGVKESDVNVSIQDNTLIISGEKKSEKKEENKTYHRVERSYGKFIRSFPLPFEVKTNAVDATFEKGLLRISIPKPSRAETKSNSVKIKSKD